MVNDLSSDQKQAIFNWLCRLNLAGLSDKVYRLLLNDMSGAEKLELLHEVWEAGARVSAEKIKELIDTRARV